MYLENEDLGGGGGGGYGESKQNLLWGISSVK